MIAAIVATVAILFNHNNKDSERHLAPYQPQSLAGTLGTIKLDRRPVAVAALGPGDPDAVLSLGVQPVAIGGIQSPLPSWLQTMVHSSATLLPNADPAALAAAKPDLIIDTGQIDKSTYDTLSAIAPTLTRPANSGQDLVWQQQLPWIATALGRSDTAKTLLDDAAAQQATIKSQHPRFGGKTIVVINYSDTTTTVVTPTSAPTNYLEGLGFRYHPYAKRTSPADPPDKPLDVNQSFYQVVTADVMIVLRTDKAAGGGGYAGLPGPFNGYSGTLVIVDDPATITALNTGGPAATSYLNHALVNKLSLLVK
ncbi:ABC transporter substrate-binding protein [Mycobacterium simiae]|uniref:ABC transporter substrate-binding protein n=1 Tax=Mycobacterium simiae TaxID=1784 RepID=A0A5B1BSB4_MYCSI|nr:ABC transporter substrate-binding protein [Mycobacterium simiae]KAA1250310.1 ABC transporter substrate-binding protein [Mycobacterium simiae]